MAEPTLTPTQSEVLLHLFGIDPLGTKPSKVNPHTGRALVTRGLAQQPTMLMQARKLYLLTAAGRALARRLAQEASG